MKEENVKKRAWVKNAAIIFLAAMLLLTFFSNSIMNRSLPEVAAKYTTSGAINARIRGMGTVSANDSYEVIFNQTRTVKEVHVRLDREVEVGDALFTLADAGSAELEAAREELERLVLEYEKVVLDESLRGDYASEYRTIELARKALSETQAERDMLAFNDSDIIEAEAAVSRAKAAVESADTAVESAGQTVKTANTAFTSATEAYDSANAELTSAQSTVASRTAEVESALRALETFSGQTAADTTALQRQISDKRGEISKKEEERASASLVHQSNYDIFESGARAHFSNPSDWEMRKATYLAAYAQLFDTLSDNPAYVAYKTMTRLNDDLAELNTQLTRLQQDLSVIEAENAGQAANSFQQYNQLNIKYQDAISALSTAEAVLRNTKAAYDHAKLVLDNAKQAHENALEAETIAKKTLTNAEAALTTAETDLATLKSKQENYENALKSANDNIKIKQESLEDLIFSLGEKQKTDGVSDAKNELDMAERRRQIEIKRKEIESLEEDDTDAVITSPVSGIIKQLSVTAGNQTQPGTPLAVIEVPDRGYSLSFTVTSEQSRKITIGDFAEVDNWWWGGEIRAVLTSIRNDPQNPAASRILTFDLSGDITSGTQLSLSIGERNANYDVIVPNSALRSDTNGDFVLVVLARSSPLGNRYTATRVDVNILASDDTQTAVSGGLAGWDYVITTSNKPIEPGMQVRLVDNP